MGKIELDIRQYSRTGSSNAVFDRFMKDPQNGIVRQGDVFLHKGMIPLHWEDVKANASGLSHARRKTVIETQSGQQFLLAFGEFRILYVNTLLAEVASEAGCVRKCVAVAVGSVNPTSDYDITITGPKSSRIVEEFNDRFREKWGVESGVIFDTNLYGASFIIPQQIPNFSYFLKRDLKDISKRQNIPERMLTPTDFAFYVNMEKDPKDMRWQRFWAWNKYQFWKNQVMKNTIPRNYSFLNIQNTIADSVFQTDFRLSETMYQQLTRGMNVENIAAMNKQYEKELNKLFSIRTQFDNADSMNEVAARGREMKNQISRSNFFGNETYLTQGAFNHVVGRMQSGFTGLSIHEHEYVDSFIENSAELLKEYAYHMNDVNADRMVTESSKYIIRASEAALMLIEMGLFADSDAKSMMKKRMEEASKLSLIIRSFRSKDNKISHEDQLKIIDKFYQLVGIQSGETGAPHRRTFSLGSSSDRKSRLSTIRAMTPIFQRGASDADLDPVAIARPNSMAFMSAYLDTLFLPYIEQIYRQGFPFASDYQPINPVDNQPVQPVQLQQISRIGLQMPEISEMQEIGDLPGMIQEFSDVGVVSPV